MSELLWAFTRRQHGLVTREQALTALTRHQLDTRVASRQLVVVRPSVYRLAGTPETWDQALLAAILSVGNGTAASFRSAAAIWGLRGFEADSTLEITTAARRRARLSEVVVHDSRVLDETHRTMRNRIPVTSVARTLCDLTAIASSWTVERALDDALRRKLVSLRQLRTVFEELAVRGRRRSTMMRSLLDARSDAYHPGGSDPERRLLRVLAAANLPAPVPQYRVVINRRTFLLDGAYPELLVGIEFDGFDPHVTRTAFDHDRARDPALELAGW